MDLCQFRTARVINTHLRRVVAVAAVTLSFCQPMTAFAQTDDYEDDSMTISCADGTEIQAQFGETEAVLTLGEGQELKLAAKPDNNGFVYAGDGNELRGEGYEMKWTAKGKPAVSCQIAQTGGYEHFDKPVATDYENAPKDPKNPDREGLISCQRFADFAVKEVDFGERGVDKLALIGPKAACTPDTEGEIVLKGDLVGYFMGVKGHYLFIQAPDGINGGLPFSVYDARSGKFLFSDSMESEDFTTLDLTEKGMTLRFLRTYSADCSLVSDKESCAATIEKATGLGPQVPLPDCSEIYEAEKAASPEFAKEVEQFPSVISYEAELDFDGATATVKPLDGDTLCRVPD